MRYHLTSFQKKASVIRRSQLPASVAQHQAPTTDQHASEELSELSSSVITSQPAVSSNPFINFSQLTTSHLDQQQTTNPFTSTSQQSNPFLCRKLDGIFQRLSILEKNQTDIKNNQQVIMTMLSTTIQLLQGNSTSTCSPTNQSSITHASQ
ncbi:unnamed protein product [Mytilus coruscus]|uniref:Uncharacterized protein n=1 Tax=Mytilus coruscus TaxID=42192 RepID=A0A6J8EYI6_MYTCO|nr:unnamed protein product [Mytilus coruscus]